MGSGDFFRAVSKTKSNFCDYTEKKGEINPIDNEKINNNVLPFVQSVLNNPDSQSSVQKAVMTVSETNESFHLIPINSDDEEVLAFIIKYELQDPCKLFKFLIELYFASFESLAESINFVLVQDRDNIIGTIKGVKQTFLEAMSMNNAKSREIQLNTAYGDINKGISILQAKIESYIAQTRVIDEMPRYKRILKSPVLLKNIDSYNSIAKTLMDAWIEAVKVKMLLWSTPELTNNSDVYQDAITYVEGLNLRLMHDYDKDSSKEYWLKVHSRVKELKKGIPYQQLALEYCEEEIDYKNIEFN